jgi:hypothetical protein
MSLCVADNVTALSDCRDKPAPEKFWIRDSVMVSEALTLSMLLPYLNIEVVTRLM